MSGRFVRSSKYREIFFPSPQAARNLTGSRTRLRTANEKGALRTPWALLRVDIISHSSQEQCYDNLRISKNAWDTNLVKVRPLLPPPLIHHLPGPSDTTTRPTPNTSP